MEYSLIKDLKIEKLSSNMKEMHEKILAETLVNLYDSEVIYQNEEWHPGYGAGDGDIEHKEYKCPCGNGKIIEEHDNIPGFREHDVYICCNKCSKLYDLDTSMGTRYWKIVPKVKT